MVVVEVVDEAASVAVADDEPEVAEQPELAGDRRRLHRDDNVLGLQCADGSCPPATAPRTGRGTAPSAAASGPRPARCSALAPWMMAISIARCQLAGTSVRNAPLAWPRSTS